METVSLRLTSRFCGKICLLRFLKLLSHLPLLVSMRWVHFITRIFWVLEQMRLALWELRFEQSCSYDFSQIYNNLSFIIVRITLKYRPWDLSREFFFFTFYGMNVTVFCAILVYFQYVRRKHCYCCDSKFVNSFLGGFKIGESGKGLFRFGSICRTFSKLYVRPSVN